jgi:transposase
MNKQYQVHLTDPDLTQLQQLLRRGTHSARVQTRARILLLAHAGQPAAAIATALLTSTATVQRVRQRAAQEGVAAALAERPRPGRPPRLTGDGEARLTVLACTAPPPGRARWTIQLLTDRIALCEEAPAVSRETVRRHLHAHALKPWQHKQWCIPQAGARFVAKMEDVLGVYARPYNPARPVVCLDEANKTLHAASRPGQPVAPGQVTRQDYEYERGGTANLFVWVEPLTGRRGVQVTAQRTTPDFARVVRQLVDEVYPQAEQVVLVTDNLNTHGPWALYETFAPAEAARVLAKLDWHCTPEHGSWLNMAEIEIAARRRQCLARRIATPPELATDVAACVAPRNAQGGTIDWQFTTADARIKLKRLYPVLKPKSPPLTSQN